MYNITNTISKFCLKHYDKTFIINENEGNISYKEFLAELSKADSFFSEKNILKGLTNFSIVAPNCLNSLLVLFTFLRHNKVAANLNPNLQNLELVERLICANVDTLITTNEYYEKLKAYLSQSNVTNVIIINEQVFEFEVLQIIYLTKTFLFAKETNSVAAFLQFTGGTTGTLKAAVITHQQVIDNIEQLSQHMGKYIPLDNLTVLVAFPFYHIFSIVFNVLFFLRNGGTCILYKDLRNTDLIVELLKTQPINFTVGVNTWYKKLMQHPSFSEIDFSNIHTSFAGGEYVPLSTKQQWQKQTGKPLYSAYGLTETCSLAIVSPLDNSNIDDCIGVTIPNTKAILLNENNEEIRDLNTPGEIALKGLQVTKEYFNNADETNSAFYNGWFKTGDIAVKLNQKTFKIVDRKKDMISVSGNKVYPNEVESVLSKLEDVLDVGVVARKSKKSGEEVVACVVLIEKSVLTNENIIDFCAKYLSRFKVPKQIYRFKELPKTPIGKTFRKELREIVQLKQANHD